MHGGDPSSESVPGLEEFKVLEAILGEVAGGGEAGDAASDDQELIIIVKLRLQVWIRISHGLRLLPRLLTLALSPVFRTEKL